jgi:hypothetical protein
VVGKIDELCSVASEIKPDLILVTESWCNDQILDAFIAVPGFELVNDLRKDRYDTDRGRGGGLLVYTRKDMKVCVLLSDGYEANLQYCKFKVDDIVIFLVYRSPSGGPESVSGMADLLREADKNCIFFGDFNLPEIDWDGGVARGGAREFMEAVEDRLMEQLVTSSTHVRGNILDLVLTDIPEWVSEVTDEGRLGASDHVMLLTKIVIKSSPPATSRGLPDWRRAGWPAIKLALGRENWDQKMRIKTAEQAWSLLKVRIEELVSQHVPARRRRNHDRPPWLSREILRAIRRRAATLGQQVEEYRAADRDVRNKIRNAKRRFERDIANGCGSERASKKKFFAYIKQKTKSRTGIGPLKDSSGKTVQEDGEMAELLNSFFSSVYERGHCQHPGSSRHGLQSRTEKYQDYRERCARKSDGCGSTRQPGRTEWGRCY